MSKRTNEEIFKCRCPIEDCYNKDIINWHHCGCPSFYDLFISDKGIIRCENCGMEEEFFNCKYDCGNHNDESKSARFRYPTSLKKVLAVIGALEDDGIYSLDFVDLLAESLRKQFRRKFR